MDRYLIRKKTRIGGLLIIVLGIVALLVCAAFEWDTIGLWLAVLAAFCAAALMGAGQLWFLYLDKPILFVKNCPTRKTWRCCCIIVILLIVYYFVWGRDLTFDISEESTWDVFALYVISGAVLGLCLTHVIFYVTMILTDRFHDRF